jgi:hypothetical protein
LLLPFFCAHPAGTLKEVPLRYLMQRLGVTRDPEEAAQDAKDALAGRLSNGSGRATPVASSAALAAAPKQGSPWTASIVGPTPAEDANVPHMLSHDYSSFEVQGCGACVAWL